MATRRKSSTSSDSYHHGNLREALLEAALGLIRETGPQAFTLREVARRAGVSHAAPYRHFADKDALVAAIAEDGFRRLDAALADSMAGAETAFEAFRASGEAYVRFGLGHPTHYRIMFGASVSDPGRHPALAEVGQASFGRLIAGIEACQAEGEVREGDPMELALAVWSMVHGLVSLLIDDRLGEGMGDRTPEQLAAIVSQTLFDGIRHS